MALGRNVNPIISVLGSALVILSLGMLTIHISLGLLFTTRERLPARVARDPRLGAVLPILPVAAIFLITEWLALTGAVSFASLLGFVTVMTLTTLGGFFPILLVIAGRRKSDVVLDRASGVPGNAALLSGVYALYLGIIFVYGLFVWSTSLQRATTLLAALSISIGTAMVFRRGMLNRRLVVEVRDDEHPGAGPNFAIVRAGHPLEARLTIEAGAHARREVSADGSLPPFSQLRTLQFDLPAADAVEIKLWVHRVSALGESAGIPSIVTVGEGADARVVDLTPARGWVVLPLGARPSSVTIDLTSPTTPTSSRDSQSDFLPEMD